MIFQIRKTIHIKNKPGLLHFILDTYLSVKQGDIKYHFKSLWYDSTWDWTQVYRTIDEHSNH